MSRTCSTMGEMRNAYHILVRKPEGKRPRDHLEDIEWILGK